VLILRAAEKQEPTVSAFLRTDEWRHYCIDAEIMYTLFVDDIGPTYVVFITVKNDIFVGACLLKILCIIMQGVLNYEERLQRAKRNYS